MTRDGNPVPNAQQWKDLVRESFRVEMRVEFKWVKGHKSSAHNKAVDRVAKSSAKGVLRPPINVTSVSRKSTSNSVEPGSVQLTGQRLTIRIITDEYLKVQRVYLNRSSVDGPRRAAQDQRDTGGGHALQSMRWTVVATRSVLSAVRHTGRGRLSPSAGQCSVGHAPRRVE
jgi:hypothetical protein